MLEPATLVEILDYRVLAGKGYAFPIDLGDFSVDVSNGVLRVHRGIDLTSVSEVKLTENPSVPDLGGWLYNEAVSGNVVLTGLHGIPTSRRKATTNYTITGTPNARDRLEKYFDKSIDPSTCRPESLRNILRLHRTSRLEQYLDAIEGCDMVLVLKEEFGVTDGYAIRVMGGNVYTELNALMGSLDAEHRNSVQYYGKSVSETYRLNATEVRIARFQKDDEVIISFKPLGADLRDLAVTIARIGRYLVKISNIQEQFGVRSRTCHFADAKFLGQEGAHFTIDK